MRNFGPGIELTKVTEARMYLPSVAERSRDEAMEQNFLVLSDHRPFM
jgi:hypothetical protein